MFPSLVLLTGVLAPAVRAADATIFPVALGPGANLHGEVIGTGGELETTYVLSGETSGVPFTLTLAEDASLIAEKVSFPSLSADLQIGCVVTAGSAVCENVEVSGEVTQTLQSTTLPFSPFAVPVSTAHVLSATTTSHSTRSVTASSSRASNSTTSSVRPSNSSAVTSSRSSVSVSTASIVSSSASTDSSSSSPSSDASGLFMPCHALVLSSLVAAFWVLI